MIRVSLIKYMFILEIQEAPICKLSLKGSVRLISLKGVYLVRVKPYREITVDNLCDVKP